MSKRSTARRTTRARHADSRSHYRRPLWFEPLEDRRLLAVVTVDTIDDSIDFNDGLTSLREAIFATNTVPGADTIEFDASLTAGDPATIVLTLGELAITDSLTINGPGAGLLTIDASGNDIAPNIPGGGTRVFDINDGVTGSTKNVEIRDLTLTGGDRSVLGGAIYSRELLLAERLYIVDNWAAIGGAIALFVENGVSTIADCSFSTNVASSQGGAIYVHGTPTGTVIIRDSTITQNQANRGGALYADPASAGSSLIITGTTIADNSAVQEGGAIFLSSNAAPATTIRSTTLSGNTAGMQGGAIFASGVRELSIVDGTILGNVSEGSSASTSRGGGVYCTNGDLTISASTISGNTAAAGGGVFSQGGELAVSFSTIGDNTATAGDGGGILSQNDRLTLIGCMISGNAASRGSTQGGRGGGLLHAPSFAAPSTLLDTVISDNSASELGGGLYFSPVSETAGSGSLTLNNLTITRNSAKLGGGVATAGASPRVIGTLSMIGGSISNNTAAVNGGGLYLGCNLNVNGTTISRNDAGTHGGGIATRQNSTQLSLSIVDATIHENRAGVGGQTGFTGDGGGVWISNNSVLISLVQSSVANNSARNGGGVFRQSSGSQGTLSIAGSTISGNSAEQRGGGIYNQGGLFSVSGSIIAGNSAVREAGTGGGIFNRQADLSIVNSSVNNNSAEQGRGGGIFHENGDLTVVGSTIAANSARGDGGGASVSVSASDRINIVASTVSGNTSSFGTGGLWLSGATTIRHSTISRNSGVGGGSTTGGVFFQVGQNAIEIDHAIIADNTDTKSSAPDLRFSAPSSLIHLRYTLIGDASGTSLVEAPLGSPDVNGNLIGKAVSAGGSAVIDPLLGPLADNGGFLLPDGSHIKTHALLPGSPALDGGALVTGPPQGYDQRGNPFSRMVDGTGDGVVRIDIGAYESQGVPHFSPGDYNRDGLVDACDYTEWRESFGSQREPFSGADGNGNGIVDQADYEIWKSHFGQGLTFTSGGGGSGGTSMVVESIAGPPAERGAVSAAIDVALPEGLLHPPSALRGDGSGATAVHAKSTRFDMAPHSDPLLAWLATQPRGRSSSDEAVTSLPDRGATKEGDAALQNETLDLAFASFNKL